MNKQSLKNNLSESHDSFLFFLEKLSKDEFLVSNNQKWTAAQQLEHIYLSVKIVRQVLILPPFFIKLIWGKSNKKSRTYDELVKKYQLKLENGGRATSGFVPKAVNHQQALFLLKTIKNEVISLNKKLDKFTEEELDSCVLPHPLLGKLSIRETLYFTIYHVGHHEKQTKLNLKK
jgi:hypothetical protein